MPLRCVVDTNVATTANALNVSAGAACMAASAKALQAVMKSGHVFVDDGRRIIDEHRANLSDKGQPGPGDAFLRWLLTNEWNARRVTRVAITPRKGDAEDFVELPAPPDGVVYDRSDRKFLAVAAAHADRPPILQSFDSKWWGWTDALRAIGVSIHFLCEHEIAKKHAAKHGPTKKKSR
jgi:hypothetical protein